MDHLLKLEDRIFFHGPLILKKFALHVILLIRQNTIKCDTKGFWFCGLISSAVGASGFFNVCYAWFVFVVSVLFLVKRRLNVSDN